LDRKTRREKQELVLLCDVTVYELTDSIGSETVLVNVIIIWVFPTFAHITAISSVFEFWDL